MIDDGAPGFARWVDMRSRGWTLRGIVQVGKVNKMYRTSVQDQRSALHEEGRRNEDRGNLPGA